MRSIKYFSLVKRIFSSPLARSSGIYTVSGFINAAIPLVLLPLLTRKLTPSDYGIVAMFQIAVSVVYPFIGMNLEGSIGRKYYDKDDTHFPSYIGTCLLLAGCSFVIVTVFFWIGIGYIEKWTDIPGPWLKYILIVALCQFITSVVLVIYQIRVKPIKYGIIQITQSLFNVGLSIYLVVYLNKNWNGRLEAQIITGIVFALVCLLILFISRQIHFNVKKADVKHALNFGLPLIPHAIGGMFFVAVDRFFLTNIIGLEQTGNYTVAYQIGAVIGIFTFAFNNAYVPWLFENLNRDEINIKKKIVKLTYLYFILLTVGAIILLVGFPYIVSIFIGSSFKSINVYSTFIVFGFVFQGMYYMVTNYITYAQKTYVQAAVTISVGIIKLPIAYFAIVLLGPVGAAVSYCLTFFLFFLATWILSVKVYSMPWTKAFSS